MKKVAEAGGKVLGEPMEIPGVGQYVSFFDTEGNRVSMLQPIPRNYMRRSRNREDRMAALQRDHRLPVVRQRGRGSGASGPPHRCGLSVTIRPDQAPRAHHRRRRIPAHHAIPARGQTAEFGGVVQSRMN